MLRTCTCSYRDVPFYTLRPFLSTHTLRQKGVCEAWGRGEEGRPGVPEGCGHEGLQAAAVPRGEVRGLQLDGTERRVVQA